MSLLVTVADVPAKGAEFGLAFLSVVATAPGFFIGAVPFGPAFFTFFKMGFLCIRRFVRLSPDFFSEA